MKQSLIISFILTLAFSIQQQNLKQNLKFYNRTGQSITPAMKSNLLQVIRDAYSFYEVDVKANSEYIQSKLQGAYNGYFNVLIMTDNYQSALGMAYSTTDREAYVLWSQVNPDQPTWIYTIQIFTERTGLTRKYIEGSSLQGAGIDESKKKEIQAAIKNSHRIMLCQNNVEATKIASEMAFLDGNDWMVYITSYKANKSFTGVAFVRDEQYLLTDNGECWYLITVM